MKKLFVTVFALALIAGAVWAAEVDDLNTTDASNTARFPEGMSPGAVNDSARQLEGLLARWYKDTNCSLAAAGSAGAFTLAINSTDTLYDGQVFCFEANHSPSATATLNVTNSGGSAQGAKDIRKSYNAALVSGDITSGQKLTVVYDAAEDFFQVLSSVPSGASLSADNTWTGEQTFSDQTFWAIGTTEASATTLALNGDGNIYSISGTATITSVTGVTQGGYYVFVATGAWTINDDGDNIIIDPSSTYTMGAGQVSVWYAHANNKITFVGGHTLFASVATVQAGTNNSLAVTAGRMGEHPRIAWSNQAESTATGGTEIEYTSIPSTAQDIFIFFEGLSLSGTDELQVVLGDSGGYETSGYTGTTYLTGSGGNNRALSNGFDFVYSGAAATTYEGYIHLHHQGGNLWTAYSRTLAPTSSHQDMIGIKSLTGTLDRLKIASNGTDTIDVNDGLFVSYR